jgi:23S rRNA maturation-related 3'-5' exoribonuclease YhaM
LNKTYRDCEKTKTTISTVGEETIELPTGIDKMKSTTKATKDTEVENYESDKKVFRKMRSLKIGSIYKLPKR